MDGDNEAEAVWDPDMDTVGDVDWDVAVGK